MENNMFHQFKLLGAATLALALMPSLANAAYTSPPVLDGWNYDLTQNSVTVRNPTNKNYFNPNKSAPFLNIEIDDSHRITIKKPVLFTNQWNVPVDVVVNLKLPDNTVVPLIINKNGNVKETYVSENIKKGSYYIGFTPYGNDNNIAYFLNRRVDTTWKENYTKLTLSNIHLEDLEHIKAFEQQYTKEAIRISNRDEKGMKFAGYLCLVGFSLVGGVILKDKKQLPLKKYNI